MSAEDRVITLRALNFLRSAHLPTYVALRFLLNSSPSVDESSMVTSMVERLAFSVTQRIYDVKRFKHFEANGSPKCREYSVPSPTHALAEAYALYHLHRVGLRKKADYVYSYRSPMSANYARNYVHFAGGYGQRNADVQAALRGGDVAIIFDLKSFYPSVDARSAVDKLIGTASGAKLGRPQMRVIKKCAEACIQPGATGLRIGPELSHTLADWALSDVDASLSVQFPQRYFRYVDDIVVTVPRSEVDFSSKFVYGIVENAGFELNEEKSAVATYEEWSGYINPFTYGDASIDPLSAFKFRLKIFLARNPGEVSRIGAELRKLGVFLPVEALAEATHALTWRRRIVQLWRANWVVLVKYRFDSIQDILDTAKQCQALIRDHIRKLLSGRVEPVGLVRRWYVQQARFIINRALYFLPGEDISVLEQFMREIPELEETAAVAAAISKGDFGRVALMPGPTASAAAQLARLRGIRPGKGFPWNMQSDSLVAADIAATFGVRGFDIFDGFTNPINESESNSLVRFSFGREAEGVEVSQVGYGAEIELLGSGLSYQAREQAAESRLLPDEEIVLDALALGSAYSSG